MTIPANPHEEPGMSPMEFMRLQEELHKTNAELAAANAALRASEQQLERRVEERTHELSTLLRISNNVTTTLKLEPLLGLILDQMRDVIEYRLASISTLEGDDLILLEQRGSASPMLNSRESLRDHPNTLQMLNAGEPLIIPDLNADTYLAGRVHNNIVRRGQKEVYAGSNSWMSIPLIAREKPVGVLILTHEQVNYYTPARAELVMAFANYAAIAIENAKLYTRAGDLAALEERQRLARELHDSVSQALSGIVLGARTARTLLDREPAQASEPLDYVLSLAETGLAEMRALILELHPESLRTEGLVPALEKLANALASRHQIKVQFDATDEPETSLAVKEALYRITQEALHNIAKHARAQSVDVRLTRDDDQIILQVADDGIGFDLSADHPGHLGLLTMQERAEKLGGTLAIESATSQGTRIRARLPLS